jgi:predicted MPP superfamily phosphohydrolase
MAMTRRTMIASLGGVALAAAGVEAGIFEPKRIAVTRHRIGSLGHPSRPTLGIVQLTDLHLREIGPYEERVAEAVEALRPDLIVFTGDSIDRADAVSTLRDFLKLLDPGTPKYAILGNWEYSGRVDLGRLASVYQRANCRLLVNESVIHEHAGTQLLVTGLDDLVGGQPDIEAAVHAVPEAPNHLLLAHCPAQRDLIASNRSTARETVTGKSDPIPHLTAQYMLSGHTHGGQVAFFGWAPIRPRGSGPYVSGWYREVAPEMYVSRGLGWSGLPIRFGAMPEIAFFEWTLDSLLASHSWHAAMRSPARRRHLSMPTTPGNRPRSARSGPGGFVAQELTE